MADDRYGNRDRASRSSIFSDDDGPERPARGSERDDRGFISRAGDEVRSWFGDEEAERRREQDARRYEQEHGTSGRYQGGGHEDQWTGGAPSRSGGSGGQYERSQQRLNAPGGQGDDYGRRGSSEGGFGQSYGERLGQSSGRSETRAGSHHDETYRRWRERQIEALDREYEEYCRHRQQQFESEFSSFRQTRQTSTVSPGQNAAATTAGAGNASASTSSTGSSGPASGGSASGKSTPN